MLIVCPFTPDKLRPETAAALDLIDTAGWPVQRVDVSRSDTAYAELIEQLWTDGDSFLMIEHDMVPTVAMVEQMAACPCPWAAQIYEIENHREVDGLGCTVGLGMTRFAWHLLTAEPDAATAAAEVVDGLPVRSWRGVDRRLVAVLDGRHYTAHVHRPYVPHLHDYGRTL